MPVLHIEGEIVKLNADCDVLWEKHPDMGTAVAARSDQHGDLIVIDDGMVMKFSRDGQLLWHTVRDPATSLTGLAIDFRSRIIVSGEGSFQSPYNALARYDPDGNAQWLQTLTDTGLVKVEYLAVTLDSAGNTYLTGDMTGGSSGVACLTVKVDTSGKKIWETSFVRPTDDIDIGTFIATNDSGNVYVGGYSGTMYNWDYLVIKYGQASGSDGLQPIRASPATYTLAQNYPNPFNPKTTIAYECPVRGFVSLKVYDLLGREVSTLVQGVQEPGLHTVECDATGFSSGLYFYRLQAEDHTVTKKFVILR